MKLLMFTTVSFSKRTIYKLWSFCVLDF